MSSSNPAAVAALIAAISQMPPEWVLTPCMLNKFEKVCASTLEAIGGAT